MNVYNVRMNAVVRVRVNSLVYEGRLQLAIENIFGMLMNRAMTQTYIFVLVFIVIKPHAPISEYE